MQYWQIKNPSEALVYFLDCQLATVADLALKKSKSKGEYARQIEIAQKMLDKCINYGADLSTTRGIEVVKSGLSVLTWAKNIEEKRI